MEQKSRSGFKSFETDELSTCELGKQDTNKFLQQHRYVWSS